MLLSWFLFLLKVRDDVFFVRKAKSDVLLTAMSDDPIELREEAATYFTTFSYIFCFVSLARRIDRRMSMPTLNQNGQHIFR